MFYELGKSFRHIKLTTLQLKHYYSDTLYNVMLIMLICTNVNLPQLDVEFFGYEFGLAATFVQPLVILFTYFCKFLGGGGL